MDGEGTGGRGDAAAPPIEAWREHLLNQVLRVVLVLSVAVIGPSVAYLIALGEIGLAVFDLAALGMLATLTFATRLAYRTRALALVGLAYITGAWLVGVIGATGIVYLVGFPVLAALLLGLRAALLSVGASAVTLTAVGLVGWVDARLLVGDGYEAMEWLVISLNLVFVSAVIAVPAALLLRRLETAVATEQWTAATLAGQRRQLARRNEELEHEVAERRRAETEVSRLALAVAQASDLILVADPDGRVIYSNHAAESLTEDGVGLDTGSLTALVGATHATSLGQALVSGSGWSGEVVADGGARNLVLDAAVAPVRGREGTIETFVAVLRDVSSEREMEAKLRRAEKLEALGTLASGVAHDFNNVLSTILVVAERRAAEPARDGLGGDMETILAACHRARDVVRQMMLFGRHTDLDRRPASVRDTVRDALPLLRATLPARITLSTELEADGQVRMRPAEIDQILINLVTNAVYALTTAQTDEPRITVALRRGDADEHAPGWLTLAVADNGPGIDAEQVPRIFDPFFTTKGPTEGTGLGLASVHAAVTSLGAEIEVDNRPGAGCAFVITLPGVVPAHATRDDGSTASGGDPAGQNDTPGAPEGERALIRDDAAPDGRAVTQILLVDDEELLRGTMADALGMLGYGVHEAADGDEGLAAYTRDPDSFDLVITDLTMPGRDGVQLLHDVRALRSTVPVIICSGFADAETSRRLDQDDVTAWLNKPYTLAQLTEVVAAVTR